MVKWNVPIKSSSELGAFINQLFLKNLMTIKHHTM